MSHLGEDAEAFFKKGDEGTYEGGPRSVIPSSRDCLIEGDETLTTELIADQLERRSRMQRLVTKIVAGLGVGVLLLLPFRLRWSHAAAQAMTESLGTIAPRTHATPSPLSVAQANTLKMSDVSAAPDVPGMANAAPVAAATPIAAVPVPDVHPAAKVDGKPSARSVRAPARGYRPHADAGHSQQRGNRIATGVTRPTKKVAPAPPSSVHRTPESHAPPTATFPD